MEEAFRSISQAFERNRQGTTSLEVALLVLLGLVLLLQLVALVRRLLDRATRLRRLAAERGMGPDDLALLRRLAEGESTDPASLLTHLDHFERATARALAPPAAGPGPAGEPVHAAVALAEAIHRLRHLTGFDRLPAHAPLLSTRELPPGTAVTLGVLHGQIAEAGEAVFTVELAAPAALMPGAEAELGLAHAREARYALRCRVMASGPAAHGGWLLRLGHDEAPQRIQQRSYARLALEGPLVLRPALARGAWPGERPELRARLVDLSGGGVLATSRAGLPVGLLTRASFAVGDAMFSEVRAVVIRAERAGPDGWRLHLEFSRVPESERARLVAALERLEAVQAHQQASG